MEKRGEEVRVRWEKMRRSICLMYATAAFTGAILLHISGPGGVLAQSRAPLTDAEYSLKANVETNSKMMDEMEEKQSAIDRHLEATDRQVAEDSNRISTIQGAGTGVLTVLGVLQLFGLVAQVKTK